MFTSTGNNFGAAEIQFKDYQEEHFIVLNAKFTFDPTSAEYLAADNLEIYVPDLSLTRSFETPVFMKYVDLRQIGENIRRFDGGDIAKSWIKDKNTICIEKQSTVEDHGEITVFVAAMYAQKNQGADAVRLAKDTTVKIPTNVYFGSNGVYAVVQEHWAFLSFYITSVRSSHEDDTWEVTIENFPTDIDSYATLCGGQNPYGEGLCKMAEVRIANGVLTSEIRPYHFYNSIYEPLLYAFFVRG